MIRKTVTSSMVFGFLAVAVLAFGSTSEAGFEMNSRLLAWTDKGEYVRNTDSTVELSVSATTLIDDEIVGIVSSEFTTRDNNATISATFAPTSYPGVYTALIPMSQFTNGVHNISVSLVTNATNPTSYGFATTSFSVSEVATTVGASSVDYALVNNNKDLIITIPVVDNLGSTVEGAEVIAKLYKGNKVAATFTGTTDETGYVFFVKPKIGTGTYHTVITSLTASGLTWDGLTPTNSFVK